MVDGTSGCCESSADLRATSRRTARLCTVGALPTQRGLLESRASLEATDMTPESSDRSKRQRVHMQVTGRGEHGYPVNHASGGPYPLHTTGTLDSLGLRQHESGGTVAFLHPGRERAGGMGMMGAATTTPGSTTRDSGYTEMAVARQCEREGCNVQPSYGIAWKKPRFCARHKLPGMMDVRNRRCEHAGCTRQPSYGQEGQRRQFCFTHKREGDVDVKSTRCKSAGCPKHAMYGRPGEMPQYCSTHKAEDMVDVKKRRRCNAEGCDRRASYALEGEKAAFCSAHKQPGHVNVNNRRCESHGCSRRPVFSILGEKPRFCGAHKLEGMSDSRQTADARARARAAPTRHSPAPHPGSFGGQVVPSYAGTGRSGINETMFSSTMGHAGEVLNHRTAVASRHAAAQATVSAAAAVIAAMEDEGRVDYRGGHHGGQHSDRLGRGGNGSGNSGLGNNSVALDGHDGMHSSVGMSYRDSDDGLYDSLPPAGGGGNGMSRTKPEMGGWTSALFAAEREGSWAVRASPPSSSTLAPSHGQGALWAQSRSAPMPSAATAAAAALVESSPEPSGRGGSPSMPVDYHRMPAVTPIGSSHYLDDRNNRNILNSLSGGGSGGSGDGSGGGANGSDFFSTFTSSSQPFSSTLREHGHMSGSGSGSGNGVMAWERPRPRPPPLPAPLATPSSWRGMSTDSVDVHRLAGLFPPQRLPSLLNRRSALQTPSLAYDNMGSRGVGAGGEGRGGSDEDGRTRTQG